jgi:hypothetical protein
MSGCKSCSSCKTESTPSPAKRIEKLQKGERSGNPRYPLVFVGQSAMFTDPEVQMIVTVVADQCDADRDCFTLQSQRILKESGTQCRVGESFDVTQEAGQGCWKLQALI